MLAATCSGVCGTGACGVCGGAGAAFALGARGFLGAAGFLGGEGCFGFLGGAGFAGGSGSGSGSAAPAARFGSTLDGLRPNPVRQSPGVSVQQVDPGRRA